MANSEIRAHCVASGIKMWQIADACGYSEPTLYRKLRHKLTDEEKKHFFDIIDDLKAQKNDN